MIYDITRETINFAGTALQRAGIPCFGDASVTYYTYEGTGLLLGGTGTSQLFDMVNPEGSSGLDYDKTCLYYGTYCAQSEMGTSGSATDTLQLDVQLFSLYDGNPGILVGAPTWQAKLGYTNLSVYQTVAPVLFQSALFGYSEFAPEQVLISNVYFSFVGLRFAGG